MTNEETDQFLAVFLHGANNLLESLDQMNTRIDDLSRISGKLDEISNKISE